jgi:hypothetical protein
MASLKDQMEEKDIVREREREQSMNIITGAAECE